MTSHTFGLYIFVLNSSSCVQLCATLWTVAHQAPLSKEFSRQEYRSGLPCPPPDPRNPGVEPSFHMSPILAGRFFTISTTFAYQALYHYDAAAKSLQSCPTLCDPIDGSPPGSPVPGILQARTLEWVVIAFSNAWK